MADFNTHLLGGVLVGGAFSTISYISMDLNIIQSYAVFIMGVLGGLLPDLDSDTGKPLEIISAAVSILVPALLLSNIAKQYTISAEFLIGYFTICYFIINYILCELLKRITIHRGIMHSIPFSFLAAQIAYLLFKPSGVTLATMTSCVVFFGCLIHLILDEFHSFYLKFGFIPMLKRSSGTALKFFSNNLLANLIIYSSVFAMMLLIAPELKLFIGQQDIMKIFIN